MDNLSPQLFGTLMGKLFGPLLALRSVILRQETAAGQNTIRLQIQRCIEEIVLHSLFHPEHLFEYSLAFSVKQNDDKASSTPGIRYLDLFVM